MTTRQLHGVRPAERADSAADDTGTGRGPERAVAALDVDAGHDQSGRTLPNGFDYSIIRRTPQLFSDAVNYKHRQ